MTKLERKKERKEKDAARRKKINLFV